MNKRGQSALEYLMTYGWALVVILVVIAALFALGILSPATYQGATCRGFGKIAYVDHAYDADGNFFIKLANGSGKNISSGQATVSVDCDGDGTWDATEPTTSSWKGSKEYLFNVNGTAIAACNITYSPGDNYVADVNIVYTPQGRLQQIEVATCTGAAR